MTIPHSLALLDPPAVAKILGIRVGTLASWRCEGRSPLPYLKVGGRVRYRFDDVAAFLAATTATPSAKGNNRD